MNEDLYYLMHRDDPVAMVVIDPVSGAIIKANVTGDTSVLPLGGNIDTYMLRKWWQRRAVPLSQGNIRFVLEQAGIASPQSYMVKNLGLSLTDHYWIKPINTALSWDDINLFTNNFYDAVGELQFENSQTDVPPVAISSYSPSGSTQGDLKKKWIIQNGKRYLVKGNRGPNAQESLNEIAASLLHRLQGTMPYVTYTMVKVGHAAQICCTCESFTSDMVEFIPAIDVVESVKRDNAVSMYEHFIHVCAERGLDKSITRPFLEYQILSDFILTNTDRHLNNFGVLRDTNTLQFIGMAPIFDSGCAMFWDDPRLPQKGDLRSISVNSFRKTEAKLLELVSDYSLLDIAKLPTTEQLRGIYSLDDLIPNIDAILMGYQTKIQMLAELQNK